MPEYSNEEIIQVLKKRTYYTPEAASLAIEEAIKRGIIHSEEDLYSDEFKVEELSFSWFPPISNRNTREKIRKSIARSLVIVGLIPLVFGIVEMNRGVELEKGLILVFGLTWIFCSARLYKSYHKSFVFALLASDVIGTAYIFYRLLLNTTQSIFDFFIVGTLFLLVTYGLTFLIFMRQPERN
ncbi:MAG: hypothetical protein ACK5M7_02300 [Draconibacterium sp.]